jgi:hypothetical protein
MRYKKKPVEIEAEQFFPNKLPLPDGVETYIQEKIESPDGVKSSWNGWRIYTLEGWMEVRPLDWIITGVRGEKYPCKPDIFAETYEEVAEQNPGVKGK